MVSLLLRVAFLLTPCVAAFGEDGGQRPANYELHRPVYHLTPEKGHNNDVNGLFYDTEHNVYHAFVQYANTTSGYPKGSPHTGGWYHFTSKDLAHWKRIGMPSDGTHDGGQIKGCSGGATIAPDGTPTLIWCQGLKAVPRDRGDPDLRFWNTTRPNITHGDGTYLPPDVAGFQDASVWRESSGRFRLTYGSSFCNGTCPETKPVRAGSQLLDYVSDDLESWAFLGESWRDPTAGVLPRPKFGAGAMCPFYAELGGKVVMKILDGGEFVFVGGWDDAAGGNGSAFTPDPPTRLGVSLGSGGLSAGAIMAHAPPGDRLIYMAWIRFKYDLTGYRVATNDLPNYDSSVTLPRVITLGPDGLPRWEVAPEVAALRKARPTVVTGVALDAGASRAVPLPAGAAGNEIEVRVNFSSQPGEVGVSVLSTPGGGEGVNISLGENWLTHGSPGLIYMAQSLDPLSGGKTTVGAPLVTNDTGSATHSLRVFVDHAVVEAQLDGSTSIMEGFFPLSPAEAVGLRVFAGANAAVTIDSIEVWGMDSAYE